MVRKYGKPLKKAKLLELTVKCFLHELQDEEDVSLPSSTGATVGGDGSETEDRIVYLQRRNEINTRLQARLLVRNVRWWRSGRLATRVSVVVSLIPAALSCFTVNEYC